MYRRGLPCGAGPFSYHRLMSEPKAVATGAEEILPGLWHWHLQDDRIGGFVSSSHALRTDQGTVLVECVVRQDGSVGDVQVVRSLDPTFGLDQEAIKAAKQWRFRPGTRLGEPVPVLITIELTFTLR